MFQFMLTMGACCYPSDSFSMNIGQVSEHRDDVDQFATQGLWVSLHSEEQRTKASSVVKTKRFDQLHQIHPLAKERMISNCTKKRNMMFNVPRHISLSQEYEPCVPGHSLQQCSSRYTKYRMAHLAPIACVSHQVYIIFKNRKHLPKAQWYLTRAVSGPRFETCCRDKREWAMDDAALKRYVYTYLSLRPL